MEDVLELTGTGRDIPGSTGRDIAGRTGIISAARPDKKNIY